MAVELKLILLPQPVQSKNKLSLAISVTKRRLVCSLYPTPHPCIIFVNCLFSPKTVKYASDKRLPSSKYKYSENIDLCIEIFKIHAFLTFLKRILAIVYYPWAMKLQRPSLVEKPPFQKILLYKS